ncbi:MAG: phytanoyl-CoA dioxygenase family protein [Planctomycetota bacterium]
MRLSRELSANAEELFRALIEPSRCRAWFQPLGPVPAADITIEPKLGGRWSAEFHPRGAPVVRVSATIARLEPGKVLELDLAPTLLPVATSLVVELAPVQTGTRITLTHHDVPPEQHEMTRGAWSHCLDRILGACPEALDRFYSAFRTSSGFHSTFGGLWPDRADASARLDARHAHGEFDDHDRELFRHWIRHGFVALPGAVEKALCDRIRDEVEGHWSRGNDEVRIESFDGVASVRTMRPELRDLPHKVLDYHMISSLARDAIFAPAVVRFLDRLFERPPTAFQSLLFRFGTEQAMHQDTAYVLLQSPMEFVGCWLALEDVQEGSGELQYFAGSHRIPEFLWFGRSRAMPYGYADDADFLRWVDEKSRAAGCPVLRFLPRKGDVLLWHADLAHGGSPRTRRELTRHSLVTHFCPLDVDPIYTRTRPGPPPREHRPGRWYRAPGK